MIYSAEFNCLIAGEKQGDCPLWDVGLTQSENDNRKQYQENEALEFADTLWCNAPTMDQRVV
jgi:hypothetical protein